MTSPRLHVGPWTVTVHRARSVREIRSRDEARRIVEAAVEQIGVHGVRDLLGQSGPFHADDDDSSTARALEESLLDGTVVVVIQEAAPRLLDPPRVAPISELIIDGPGGMEPKRPEPVEDTTFVAFRLLDEDGTPIPKHPFTLVLPDGRRVDGVTDSAGRFELATVHEPGSCSVEFGTLWS